MLTSTPFSFSFPDSYTTLRFFIGQFTQTWTQQMLDQSISDKASLYLVLLRNSNPNATTAPKTTTSSSSSTSNNNHNPYFTKPKPFNVSKRDDNEGKYLQEQLLKFQAGNLVLQQSLSNGKTKMLMRKNKDTGKIDWVEEKGAAVDSLIQRASLSRTTSTSSAKESTKSEEDNSNWPAPPPGNRVSAPPVFTQPSKLEKSRNNIQNKISKILSSQIENNSDVQFGAYKPQPVVASIEQGQMSQLKQGSGSVALAAEMEKQLNIN